MARFDVYPMPGGGTGFIVDVQADLLSHLRTRVVVPLLPEAMAPKPISLLNPVFDINGERCVLATQGIASIPGQECKSLVMSIAGHHDELVRALDILLVGF